MIQVNRIYLIFNRLVTKKFLVDTSDLLFKKRIVLYQFVSQQKEKMEFWCSFFCMLVRWRWNNSCGYFIYDSSKNGI